MSSRLQTRIISGFLSGLFLFVLSFQQKTPASDWPQFLGPSRNGVYPSADLKSNWPESGPTTLWKKKVGTGWAGPVVTGKRLILFHREDGSEIVECLNVRTGEAIWRHGYASDYVDGFGFDNGPRATPCIADERVYTLGANGALHCVDLKSGSLIWKIDVRKQFSAPKGFFGMACSPLVDDGRLLLNIGGTDGAGIICLNARTGKTIWKATDDEASYSSPVIGDFNGKKQAVFFTRNNLFALDPQRGSVSWQYSLGPSMQASVSAAVPLVIDGSVFASASYGAGAVLLNVSGKTPEAVWRSDDILSCQYNTAIARDGHLYGFDGRLDTGPRPELRCVEIRTGRIKWKTSRIDAGSIILAKNNLLILTVSGQLIQAKATASNYDETGRTQILGLEVRSHPALAGGLYFARDKRQLVCIDLRK